MTVTQAQIDGLFTLIRHFNTFSDVIRSSILELIVDLATFAIEQMKEDIDQDSRQGIKILFYFLFALLGKGDSSLTENSSSKTSKKSKSKTANLSDSSWNHYHVRMLDLTLAFLENDRNVCLWSMGIMHENFVATIWQPCLQQLIARCSNHSSHDKQVKSFCVSIIVSSVKFFGNPKNSGSYAALTSALLDTVISFENMAPIVSEICSKSSEICDHINSELFGDIGNMNMSQVSSSGLKNIGGFLDAMARENSDIVSKYFPVLLPQLDSSAHQIRYVGIYQSTRYDFVYLQMTMMSLLSI